MVLEKATSFNSEYNMIEQPTTFYLNRTLRENIGVLKYYFSYSIVMET